MGETDEFLSPGKNSPEEVMPKDITLLSHPDIIPSPHINHPDIIPSDVPVSSHPRLPAPTGQKSPLLPKHLRKLSYLTRNTRTHKEMVRDKTKNSRPRPSTVLPRYQDDDDYSPRSSSSGANAYVTRKSVMISEVGVRTVSFLQSMLAGENESPGTLPRLKGGQFARQDFKALLAKMTEHIDGPVNKYLYDLALYLVQEMAKEGLSLGVSSPVQVTAQNESLVRVWLSKKIEEFHEPYRL